MIFDLQLGVLKKENRISKRKEVEEMKRLRSVYQSPIFGMLLADKKDNQRKFLMVVSKKISKKAVDRNRIRRLLSEAVRLNLEQVREGVRVGFLVRKAILGKGLEEVKREVEAGLVKTGVVEK